MENHYLKVIINRLVPHNSSQLFDIIKRNNNSGVSNSHGFDFIYDLRDLHVSLACQRSHHEHKRINVRAPKHMKCDVPEAALTPDYCEYG